MSTPQRPPLLSDDEMQGVALGYYTKEHVKKYRSAKEMYNASYVAVHKIRDIYEAERAKDAELIQQLVDGLHFERMSLVSCMESQKALDAAAAAGFKPSEP